MTITASVGDVVSLLDAVADGSNYKVFGISISIGTIQTYCTGSVNFYNTMFSDGTISVKASVCNDIAILRAGADTLKVLRGKLLGQPSYTIDGVQINKTQYITIINDLVNDYNVRIEQYLRSIQEMGEVVDIVQPDYSEDSCFVG